MDGDPHNPADLDESALGALQVIAASCARARSEPDLEKLVLTIDRQLRILQFDFVSLTLHRLVDPEDRRFESHVVTASTEYKRATQRREGVFGDWKSGKIIYRRNLDHSLEGLPSESLRKREANIGVSVKSTVNIPFSRGTLVLRSQRPEAFGDSQIEFLLRVTHELSLIPLFQNS